jgi:hypothetical protein
MDYFRRAKQSLSTSKLFAVSEYQQAFQKALLQNTYLVAQLRCAQYEQEVYECQESRGGGDEHHPECNEARLTASLCMCDVLAHSHYTQWAQCAQKNQDDPEACSAQFIEMLENAQQAAEKAYEDLSHPTAEEQSQIRAIHTQCAGVSEEEQLGCAGQITCASQYRNFVECVDSHGGDYESLSCRSYGTSLSACLGERCS